MKKRLRNFASARRYMKSAATKAGMSLEAFKLALNVTPKELNEIVVEVMAMDESRDKVKNLIVWIESCAGAKTYPLKMNISYLDECFDGSELFIQFFWPSVPSLLEPSVICLTRKQCRNVVNSFRWAHLIQCGDI